MEMKEAVVQCLQGQTPPRHLWHKLSFMVAFGFLAIYAFVTFKWVDTYMSPYYNGIPIFLIAPGIMWILSALGQLMQSPPTPIFFNIGAFFHFVYWCTYIGDISPEVTEIEDHLILASCMMRAFALIALGVTFIACETEYSSVATRKNYTMYGIMAHWFFQGLHHVLFAFGWGEFDRTIFYMLPGITFLLGLICFYLYKSQIYPNPVYIKYHMYSCVCGAILYFIAIGYSYSNQAYDDYDGRGTEIAWQIFYCFAYFPIAGLNFYLTLEEEDSEPAAGGPAAIAINQSAANPNFDEPTRKNDIAPVYTPSNNAPTHISPNAPPSYNMPPPTYDNAEGSGAPLPSSAPPASGDSLASQLHALNDMRNQGILTEEEFTKAKAKLLG